MQKKNNRQMRMAGSIRDVVASYLVSGKLSDPALEQVTVTRVKLTADLQLASVYFRVFDESRKMKAQRALERVQGIFRTQLADALEVRRVPSLRYFYDESIEQSERIETLLAHISVV